MKSLLNAIANRFIATIASLMVVSDLIQPLLDIGAYIFIVLGVWLAYVCYTARRFPDVEVLIEKEKILSHLDNLQGFYRQHWRGGVIFTYTLAFLIASSGALLTYLNKDEGGALASVSETVQSLQQQLLRLEAGQKTIEHKVDEVHKSVNEVQQAMGAISVDEILTRTRQSDTPARTLSQLLQTNQLRRPLTVSEAKYLAGVLSERGSMFMGVIYSNFFDTCEAGSVNEADMLELLYLFNNVSHLQDRGLLTSYWRAIQHCLDGRPTVATAKYALTGKDGVIDPLFFPDHKALAEIMRLCDQPIELSYFKNPSFFPVDYAYKSIQLNKIANIYRARQQHSMTCISDEVASYLNARMNRIQLLNQSYYMDSLHIFTNECEPRVTQAEIDRAVARGVKADRHQKNDEFLTHCMAP